MSNNEKSARSETPGHLAPGLTGPRADLYHETALFDPGREADLYGIEIQRRDEELRRIRQELEMVRRDYADLYNHAPAAFITSDQEGIITQANAAAASVMGKKPSDLIGHSFAEYVDDLYTNSYLVHIDRAKGCHSQVGCELFLKTPDSSRLPILMESVVTSVTGDISIRSTISEIDEPRGLKEWQAFQELLSTISTSFINLPANQVDSEIGGALQRVIELFRADHVAMLEINQDGRTALTTHTACSQGIEPKAEFDLSALFPWHYQRLVGQGAFVCITRLGQLPPEAEQDRNVFAEWGVRSSLMIPVKIGDRITRLFSMYAVREEREWDRDYTRLRLLAEIFAGGLERKRKELELQQLRLELERENVYLRQEARLRFDHEEIIGRSDALKRVLVQAEQVAATDSTVLILGETGTGKELVAQSIHRLSKRKDRVMVKVNCASLPAPLIESELFGREKGAYTGALSKQVGRFEIANGSTLFLDEIAELTPELQAKLLMVLQDGSFERLGSPQTIRVNVRVIAATNRNLAEAVQKGTFREDLFYRLNVFPIHIPPLRERREDIPLLVMAFLDEFGRKMGKKIGAVPRKTVEMLLQYQWPGNVRELRNVIEQAVIISSGECLRVNIPRPAAPATAANSFDRNLRDVQYRHIVEVLEATGWRIKGPGGAAEILGIKPSTLYTKMESLGIPTRQERAGNVSRG